MKRRLLTEKDFEKLDSLLESTSNESTDSLNELKELLLTALVMPGKNISARVVTINSTVKLRSTRTNQETEFTLTLPHQADLHKTNVSIFSDAGTSLLGCGLGDIVSWSDNDGKDRFEIIEVIQRPSPALKGVLF